MLAGAALAGSSLFGQSLSGAALPDARSALVAPAVTTPTVPIAVPPPPPTIAQSLESGVLIVVSKASQRMEVFKDGQPWLTSPVSTGKRGHGTPSGVFPILEKQRFHRSNIYSNAPMPFMQRLTRGGIAIHAGHLPGYPASHGCIRVPFGVARTLFGLTARQTPVVVTSEPISSEDQARSIALAMQPSQSAAPVQLAVARPIVHAAPIASPPPPPPAPQPRVAGGQTIQLAAALSPQEAEARWTGLVGHHAELARLDRTVIPVTVASRRFFRLRASGPDAFATCSRLKSAGVDCFKVL